MTMKLLHEELRARALANPEVRKQYEALENEYDLLKNLVDARKRAKKTQAQVAMEMGTTASAVARLEAGGGKKKHSPSLSTLRRYAKAVGCDLKVELIPLEV